MIAQLLLVLGVALSPVDLYNQGNRLYAQKDYAHAADAYRQALAAAPGPRVEYNLGNALFKTGHVGEAIVHWRRARYLAPRDADVRTNLAFARSYRVDKVLVIPSPLARAFDVTFHWLSHRESAIGSGLSCLLAALLLAGWIVWRRGALLGAAAVVAVLALFCLASLRAWAGEVADRPAVVVAAEAGAWSGPGEDTKQILLLHDGTEVRLRDARGDYLLAQVPGGGGGWIRKDSLERVY